MNVCWNVTSRCNRDCIYCFKFFKKDLSLKDNKEILRKLSELGVKRIMWSGGEPFLYDGLEELLKLSKKYGIVNYVNTNATLLNYELLNMSIKYIDKLIISLDFVNDDLNTKYGIGQNYYCHVKEILNLVKKMNSNIELQINTVLFSANIQYLDELYNEICKYDIDCWKIIRFFPIRGKALDRKEKLMITDDVFADICHKLKRKKQKFNIIIHGLEEMEKLHIIVLSSGELIYSENSQDNLVDNKIN